jgi:hypothetical protein
MFTPFLLAIAELPEDCARLSPDSNYAAKQVFFKNMIRV